MTLLCGVCPVSLTEKHDPLAWPTCSPHELQGWERTPPPSDAGKELMRPALSRRAEAAAGAKAPSPATAVIAACRAGASHRRSFCSPAGKEGREDERGRRGGVAAASQRRCAFQTAAPLHLHRPAAAAATAGVGAAHPASRGAPPQTAAGAGSGPGSLVGHGRELVSDAAQPVQHSVQRFLTQLHGDG